MSSVEVPQKQDEENGRWYARFLSYLRMGPSRTLLGAVHIYEDEENRKFIEAQKSPKKRSESVPGAWRDEFNVRQWKVRAQSWDEQVQKQEEYEYECNRKAIMSRGFALQHERIRELDELANQLRAYRLNEDNMWLPGGKGDEIKFNDGLVRELRATLTDISAEMGERVKKVQQESNVTLDIVNGVHESLLADLATLPEKPQTDASQS